MSEAASVDWMSEAAIVEVEAAATARKGAIIRVTMVATAEFNAMSCATRGVLPLELELLSL